MLYAAVPCIPRVSVEVSTRLLRRNRAAFNMRQTLCARIPRELVDTKFKRLRDVGADPLARRLTIHGLQSASSTRYVEARSPRWRDPVAMDPTRGLREEQSSSEIPRILSSFRSIVGHVDDRDRDSCDPSSINNGRFFESYRRRCGRLS